jgi:hypothetical protein
MLEVDANLRRTELPEIARGLREAEVNWQIVERRTLHLAKQIELYDTYVPYPMREHPHEPLFRVMTQLKSAVLQDNKQEALRCVESLFRLTGTVG